jgi:hypothetical protein
MPYYTFAATYHVNNTAKKKVWSSHEFLATLIESYTNININHKNDLQNRYCNAQLCTFMFRWMLTTPKILQTSEKYISYIEYNLFGLWEVWCQVRVLYDTGTISDRRRRQMSVQTVWLVVKCFPDDDVSDSRRVTRIVAGVQRLVVIRFCVHISFNKLRIVHCSLNEIRWRIMYLKLLFSFVRKDVLSVCWLFF